MRYLAFLFAVLPCLALAQDSAGTVRRWSEVQSLTRSAPTASCLAASSPEGMDMRSVRGIRVGIDAPTGQTLTGGALRAYSYDFTAGAWRRVPDLDITTITSGLAGQWYADQAVLVRTGCLLYAADGVTVSSGTTVTVRITAYTGGA